MADTKSLALEAMRRLRGSPGYQSLPRREQLGLDHDLRRIEAAFDPYAIPLAEELPIPPGLLGPLPPAAATQPPTPPATAPAAKPTFGQQSAEALAAIDFPGFVAGLIHGVFQAIVDATGQQVREYADLVASLSRTVEDFSEEHVSPNQARDALVAKHGADLVLVVPAPGHTDAPRVAVRPGRERTRPPWLEAYGLGDEELSDEFVDGPLLARARIKAGEERLQTLAALVLMGINRIVVNDGDIRAKLQFHATKRESTTAELLQGAQSVGGLAGRAGAPGASMMVSTSSANAQAESSLRADLVGEVKVSFRTETFDLNNFANTEAITLISRHARWQGQTAATPRPPGTGGTP